MEASQSKSNVTLLGLKMISPWDPWKNLINQICIQVCEIWAEETVQEELGRVKQPINFKRQIRNLTYCQSCYPTWLNIVNTN